LRQSSSNDNDTKKSLIETAQQVVAQEGLSSLLFRGLSTRLYANALQGILFSVLFKYFQTN